jgi:hypothetical protein
MAGVRRAGQILGRAAVVSAKGVYLMDVFFSSSSRLAIVRVVDNNRACEEMAGSPWSFLCRPKNGTANTEVCSGLELVG